MAFFRDLSRGLGNCDVLPNVGLHANGPDGPIGKFGIPTSTYKSSGVREDLSQPSANSQIFHTSKYLCSPGHARFAGSRRYENGIPHPFHQVTPPAPPSIPPGPTAEELAGQRARQQLNQFKFLGYLTKGGESQAFLTNGQAIYIVKQGEILEGRVQVNKIEPDTVILSTQVRETGNHIQATIPLTPDTRG